MFLPVSRQATKWSNRICVNVHILITTYKATQICAFTETQKRTKTEIQKQADNGSL